MPLPYIGHNSAIGFGIESTWGTTVARDKFLRPMSVPSVRVTNWSPRASLGRAAQPSRMPTLTSYAGTEAVTGSLSFEAAYDDFTVGLVVAAMGASSVTTTGAGPYTHTILPKSAEYEGLSCELRRGDSGEAELIAGMVPSGFVFSWSAGQQCMVEFPFIAKTSSRSTSLTTVTYSSNGECVNHDAGGRLNYGGTLYATSSGRITFDRGITGRSLLGSRTIQKPVAASMMSATFEFEIEYDSDSDGVFWPAAHNSGAAPGSNTLEVAFTSGTKSLTISSNSVEILGVSDPISGPGRIMQRVTGRMLANADTAAQQGIKVVYINGNSSALAN